MEKQSQLLNKIAKLSNELLNKCAKCNDFDIYELIGLEISISSFDKAEESIVFSNFDTPIIILTPTIILLKVLGKKEASLVNHFNQYSINELSKRTKPIKALLSRITEELSQS